MAEEPLRGRPKPIEEAAEVVGNVQLHGPLWDMRLAAPGISAAVLPGQFIHMQVPGMQASILRRPFSVYSADDGTLGILYQVVGRGSAHMTSLRPGDAASIMGPLGNSWHLPEGARRVLFVVGGVGAAPLLMFGHQVVASGARLDVCMGAQTRDALVMRGRYEALEGCGLAIATDDGSCGQEGFVTGPAAALLHDNGYDLVCCCGPEPLMRSVAEMSAQADVPCQVSLERRMACGIGACLSCVVDTVEGRKRSCVDGPVFDARKVVW